MAPKTKTRSPAAQKKKPAAPAAPPPHPLVDYTLSLLGKTKTGEYRLLKPQADQLRHALMDLNGRPDFGLAVKDLVMLAQLLESRFRSLLAAQALLETTEAALLLSRGEAAPKRPDSVL